jgi:hypothetical protein
MRLINRSFTLKLLDLSGVAQISSIKLPHADPCLQVTHHTFDVLESASCREELQSANEKIRLRSVA